MRTSIRDIALSLHVHHSTVSRALKNDLRLSQSTRDRVTAAAEKMGYRPDPFLAGLMEYRANRSKKKLQATLAWITNYSSRDGWKHYERSAYYKGACARAQQLGYNIEDFWLSEPGLDQRRAIQILLARNIQGLFFLPQPRSRTHLILEWGNFSAISFGRTLARPRFHNVNHDHYRSFACVMRKLKSLGYRRPGLVSVPRIEESVERSWRAAFAAYQTLSPREQIPVFLHRPSPLDEFQAWLYKYKADIVVTSDESLLKWVEVSGMKVPKDIGFVLAAKHAESEPSTTGMLENNELVGKVAVDVLVQMINRGEMGPPKDPISTLVEGRWSQGLTVRATVRDRCQA
jgi:LacI family transcriptional regulator